MNRVFLHGNVGKDPVIRKLESGKSVASFSLATSKYVKDREGNKTTQTAWHNIVAWEKLSELSEKYIKKGSSILIEGEIQYRNYTDKDGNIKYLTEIIANSIYFTGGKKEDTTSAPSQSPGPAQNPVSEPAQDNHLPEAQPAPENTDDLPF